VLVLAVTIVLAVLSVATFPCWSYSGRWGYTPSVIAAALLLCAAMIVVGSKYAPKDTEADVAMATISPAHGVHGRIVDAMIVAPDTTLR